MWPRKLSKDGVVNPTNRLLWSVFPLYRWGRSPKLRPLRGQDQSKRTVQDGSDSNGGTGRVGTPGQGQRGLWDLHVSSEDREDAVRRWQRPGLGLLL